MKALVFLRRSLRRRLILLVGLWMVALAAILLAASMWGTQEVSERALNERQHLAQALADNIDYVLKSNLVLLQEASLTIRGRLENNDLQGVKKALQETYLRSLFTESVFLVDGQGKTVWVEPYHTEKIRESLYLLQPVQAALRDGRPEVSNLISEPAKRVYATVPVRDWHGKLVGVVGGELDPQNPRFSSLVHSNRLGEGIYVDVVDGRGRVLASTKPDRMFMDSDHGRFLVGLIKQKKSVVGSCHSCHEKVGSSDREREVIAFAPLTNASWGLTIRQPENEALALVSGVKRTLLTAGFLTILVALLFAWGMARSLTRPLRILTQAARRITEGNLDEPIRPLGDDEIGSLGRSLDNMRMTLNTSMEAVAEGKRELESKVQERTKELQSLYQELQKQEEARGELLKKLILAQEEERKRIARELHDETSQDLATFLLSIETSASSASGELKDGFLRMKAIANRALDSIHRLIYDLRPSVLDDLGLSSALRWTAENRLEVMGIDVSIDIVGAERRVKPEVETCLFRIGQEAISNIAKYAEANAVKITLQYSCGSILLEVEDNGKGFELKRVLTSAEKSLGLLGMKERANLLNGNLSVISTPQTGTRVRVEIPVADWLEPNFGNHEKDQSPHC
jgi:signal transduction histidine kinase